MKHCINKLIKNNSYRAVAIMLSAVVFFLGGYLLFSQPGVPSDPSQPSYLFVQTAASGLIEPDSVGKNQYKLTVNQVNSQMSYFTDQPFHEAGTVPLSEFVANWKQRNDDGKAIEKPNVVVHGVDVKTHSRFNRIFELNQPRFDAKKHAMTYRAKLIGDQPALSGPVKMEHAVIFIDDFHWHGNRFDPPHG